MSTICNLWEIISRQDKSRSWLLLAILSSSLSGFSTVYLITLIHRILRTENLELWKSVGSFLGLWLGHGIFGILATLSVARLSQYAILELRLELSRQLLMTPLRKTEDIGRPRLLAMFTHVMNTLTSSIEHLPTFFSDVVIIFGIYTYLGWLSPQLGLIAVGFALLGSLIYILPRGKLRYYQQKRLEALNLHLNHFFSLVEGIKELLLSRDKSRSLLRSHLTPSGQQFAKLNIQSLLYATALERAGHMYAFAGVGLAILLLPGLWGVSRKDIGDFLVILLFTLPSMMNVVSSYLRLHEMTVSLEELDNIGWRLQAETRNEGAVEIDSTQSLPTPNAIEYRNIKYTYNGNHGEASFILGPLSLSLRRSEVLFISGGNGSGKSTLANILCGLYVPEHGSITLDKKAIHDKDNEDFRQLFSVVFFDFFLFDTFLGLEGKGVEKNLSQYLDRFQLSDKLTIKNNGFSPANLSQGQRRRLALLVTFLEDRPFYIFDEWAADQDSTFKKVFYEELVPELKRQGKSVIVISHDESYFHVADRLIKMENGKMID